MKRIISLLLAIAAVLSLAACGGSAQADQAPPVNTPAADAATENSIASTEVPATAPTRAPAPTEPTEILPPPFEPSYLFYDQEETGKIQIQSYQIRESEQEYLFCVSGTVTEPMVMEGYLSSDGKSDLFLNQDLSIVDGRYALEFSVSKADAEACTGVDIFFVPETGENIALTVSLPLLPWRTIGVPAGEPLTPGYFLRRSWKSDDYQIHDCYVQKLDNGFYRYTLDMTLPRRAFFTVHVLRNQDLTYRLMRFSVNGRYQYQFDIPVAEVASSTEITILICEEKSRYENLITIPSGILNALSNGTPEGEPTKLPLNKKDRGECTIQKLDNGHYRYSLTFTAQANTVCSIFDPPNGDSAFFRFLTGPQNGTQSFVLDLDAETAESISELTLIVGKNTFNVIKNLIPDTTS